jgi:hypothetical protein
MKTVSSKPLPRKEYDPMKTVSFLVLLVIALALVGMASYKYAALKFQTEIVRLEGEAMIYRNEAERYAGILRMIRDTAAKATVAEPAPASQPAAEPAPEVPAELVAEPVAP